MLVSLLANLMMEPGGIIPPVITPHGGGGETDFGLQSGRKAEDEAALRRKKILDQDDEDIFIILTNWIATWIEND